MNAKQARELAKNQMKRIEGAEAEELREIYRKIEEQITLNPGTTEIYVVCHSKRIKAALIENGYDVKEWRGRDNEQSIIINWAEDGIQHLPGINPTDYYAK